MSAPRFIVVSVTGYPIREDQPRYSSRPPGTTYSVLDRAYCNGIVQEFTMRTARTSVRSRERAELLAAELNAEHGPWPVDA